MSLVFIRPTVPDGLVSGIQWIVDGKVIDAKLVSDEFQKLYSALNTKIHDCNLEESPSYGDLTGGKITSSYRYIHNNVETLGMIHTHNGIDSAALGDGVVNRTALSTLGSTGDANGTTYSMWMLPSVGRTGKIFYGSVELTASHAEGMHFVYATVPYIGNRYFTHANRRMRGFARMRISDDSAKGKFLQPSCEILFIPDVHVQYTDYWPVLKLRYRVSSTVTNPSGVFIDWLTMHLAPWGDVNEYAA